MPISSSSANAPTIAASSIGTGFSAGMETSNSNPCCRVAMIEGSQPHLSTETRSLLRSRLRIAALLLAMGFAVFFVRNLFFTDYHSGTQLFMTFFHGGVTIALALVGGGLCHQCTFDLSTLRRAELIIFGLPAIFFVVMQWLHYDGIPIAAGGTTRYLESPSSPWILLIFIYSLYIPNAWKRAATILGILAAAPCLLFLAAWFRFSHIREHVSLFDVSSVFFFMTLAAIVGAWGVYTIGRLRREAFEAKQLGQYRLKHLLGAGGMGEVYLAEHQLMKRPVAIKLIRPGKAADPHALARFEREVRATAKLSHWNTIEIFDFGHTDDGTFYYVMEYLPGKSLADLVEQHGPLLPSRVIALMTQTCEALAEAHSIGLIHRDIKPGNIFAAYRGGVYDVAKLLDFGLAKPAMGKLDITLTQEGAITGSPLFMAPEQAVGDGEPDARSDIYALGCVAYYLLTGRPPFEAENPIKVLMAHARDAVVPPSQLQSGIPRDLEEIVLHCLEKEPQCRFADVNQLRAAFVSCSTYGTWSRQDAQCWWEANGGVSRSGEGFATPAIDQVPSPAGAMA
ncbi:MAG: protein kinase [Pirellulales bacterium]|nr:protein kinase [Pirellulales bacterium]